MQIRIVLTSLFLFSAAVLAACGGTANPTAAPAPTDVSAPTNAPAPTQAAAQPTNAPAQATTQPANQPTTAPAQPTTASNSDAVPAMTKLNLNTATGDDFLQAIPNFPNRMVREFLEYRPYVSIQQYRKEIGKYVGEQQTAEWEKYVYVPVNPNQSDRETLKQLPGVTDDLAAQIIAARPFASNDAFLEKLTALGVSQAAAGYLAQ